MIMKKINEQKEEKEEINGLVDDLNIGKPEAFHSNYGYYEGFTNIKSMWHEINDNMDSSSIAKAYTAKKESYEKFNTIDSIKAITDFLKDIESDTKFLEPE